MNKEEFLKKLQKDKLVESTSILLKEEILPLVMWGGGDVAAAVYNYLSENDIKLAGVWIDGIENGGSYHGIPIYNRKEVRAKFNKFNIILGHSNYEKGEWIKKEVSEINKVFYVASVIYGQYQKVPYEEIEKNANRYTDLCNGVADEKSVKNLLAFLNTKMTGNVQYIFDVYEEEMNYYHNDVFCVTEDEVLLDIGAYNGDTIRLFLRETQGKYKKIIAIEPDDKSFLELNNYIAANRLSNIVPSKMGAWNSKEDLKFELDDSQCSGVAMDHLKLSGEYTTIYADRIDKIFNDAITCIKINYSAGALEGIEGCEGIIRKSLPKLVMVVGFEIDKVLQFYEYITSLDLGYKFYLRFNRGMTATLTLYAVVE